jgi:hypothetical protein
MLFGSVPTSPIRSPSSSLREDPGEARRKSRSVSTSSRFRARSRARSRASSRARRTCACTCARRTSYRARSRTSAYRKAELPRKARTDKGIKRGHLVRPGTANAAQEEQEDKWYPPPTRSGYANYVIV